jgi:N-methylhydantoinase A
MEQTAARTRPAQDQISLPAGRRVVIGVDVGGTCTDCVVFRPGERIQVGKTLSTPPDFERGVLNAVAAAAQATGIPLDQLLSEADLFLHGSTVVDNVVLTRDGARVGLVTTAGFEDTLLVTRGAYGRWGGLTEDRIKHPVDTDRPPPLVAPDCIRGVRERIDWKGSVVEALDRAHARAAVRDLVETASVEAIAVSLLWSFRNPAHETLVRDIVHELYPGLHVSLSCEVAPVPGEYERTSTTVINAYAGEVTRSYLDNLSARLAAAGFRGSVLVMQGYGGLVAAADAARRPVTMLECGPVAGLVGSQQLGHVLGHRNIIAADMGGTTFKVGIVQDGQLDYAREPIVDRYHYSVPKVEVASIGAGGGSLVWIDPRDGAPKVGPKSAGSRPGPICYGLGGTEPTLTDVAGLLGYMDPGTFLGGAILLDFAKAVAIFKKRIAQPLGMDTERAAIGIYKVAAAQMADLIREVTIERGLDPRDFALHAFGGSCGLFAATFAKDLGVEMLAVPASASVNCAFGLVSADVAQDYSVALPITMPAPPERINAVMAPLCADAARKLEQSGFSSDDMRFTWSFDLRYRRQVHRLTTPYAGRVPAGAASLARLADDFEALYERRYGKGSAYRHAGIEITAIRLRATGRLARPPVDPEPLGAANPSPALIGRRRIYSDAADAMVEAPIYDYHRMQPGMIVPGPTVVHTPITTIVVQGGQTARMDSHRNLILDSRS